LLHFLIVVVETAFVIEVQQEKVLVLCEMHLIVVAAVAAVAVENEH
jgi:hypothetical protein